MLKEKIVTDWNKVDMSVRDGQTKFLAAVQAYLNAPERKREAIIARAMEYTTASDFPSSAKEAVATFHEMDEIDLGYERVFDIIDFTNAKRNSFDIVTMGSSLTFAPVMPGEKARVFKVSGEKTTVNFERYGGALQWDKIWFDDEEHWNVEEATRDFRAAWYSSRAQIFYDLISASRADSDAAWKGVAADTKAVRDVETINFACADIIDTLKSSGYDVSPETKFVIVSPIQVAARMKNAIRITLNDTASTQVNFNVELVVTTKLKSQDLNTAETAQYFVCLPGRKAKGGYRQELTILSETDILAYAETVAAWGRYAGTVADTGQFRRCATS